MAGCRMPVVVCRSPKRSCSWFKTVNVVPPKALGCCLGDSKSWSYGSSRKFVWLQSKVRMIAVKSLYDSSRKFVCLLPNVRMSCSECSYAFFRIHVLPPLESRKKQKKTCEMKKISENICRIQKKAVILHSEIKTVYDTSLVISGSLAQLNRASDYGSEGCRFESCRSHFLTAQVKHWWFVSSTE